MVASVQAEYDEIRWNMKFLVEIVSELQQGATIAEAVQGITSSLLV